MKKSNFLGIILFVICCVILIFIIVSIKESVPDYSCHRTDGTVIKEKCVELSSTEKTCYKDNKKTRKGSKVCYDQWTKLSDYIYYQRDKLANQSPENSTK